MEEKPRGQSAQSAVVLLLCGLFAFLALGTALLGSGVYRSGAALAGQNSAQRTALAYLANQVRAGDGAGDVMVTTFGGSDALVLSSEVSGSRYDTVLYCRDGLLRELYAERGLNLAPEDGVAVMELDGLSVSLQDGVITFTAAKGERSFSVSVCPRSGAAVLDGGYEEVAG